MTKKIIFFTALAACALASQAQTVLLDEDFNYRYDKSFPYMYDADGLTPHRSIAGIFYSQAVDDYMPWWVARDSNVSQDLFIASHSFYTDPGKSNDWLISVPLTIPTEGFVLEFDAQSVVVRGLEYTSDLALYITEEQLNVTDIPTVPTHLWEDVPYGADPDNCEGDWIHYTYPLDEYAGRTVYINFVNQNEDRDILCLDNIKVWRYDPVSLTIPDVEPYTLDAAAHLTAQMKVNAPDGVDDWTVSLYIDGKRTNSWNRTHDNCGYTQTFEVDIPLTTGDKTDIRWEVTSKGNPPYVIETSLTRMAFKPVHRVFFEETTSLHCGNCPAGMYVVERMLNDPDIKDLILPVSVHIASMGTDPMATPDYYLDLPVNNAAPLIFVERNPEYDGLIPAHDLLYDSTNPQSFAYRIAQRAQQWAPVDVEVAAEWVTNGADTVAVNCTATVRAPYNIDGHVYRVAFVLTENNVGLDRNPFWIQTNYLSGNVIEGDAGGWCKLPENVMNARYHEVARAISRYNGHKGSLPETMLVNQPYTFSYELPLPDTTVEINGYHAGDPIRPSQCEITAIVIDGATDRVVNGARIAMSDAAHHRFTAADLVQQLGVTDITADDPDTVQYYDLTGRPVTNPTHGVYIRVTPAGASKVIK